MPLVLRLTDPPALLLPVAIRDDPMDVPDPRLVLGGGCGTGGAVVPETDTPSLAHSSLRIRVTDGQGFRRQSRSRIKLLEVISRLAVGM